MVTTCTRPDAHRAFTLLELILVVSVLLLLMGLFVALYPALQRSAKRARTSTILAVLMTGIETGGASRASNVAPVEHPLAGSAEPRARFVRAGAPGDVTGTPIDTAGEALRAPRLGVVPAATGRVLLPDDAFADEAVPALYGMRRGQLTIIGVTCQLVTRYRQLPDPGAGRTLIAPYDAVKYPDREFLVDARLTGFKDAGFVTEALDPRTSVWEDQGDRMLAIALASSVEELTSLGAVQRPDVTRDPLLAGDRVRHDRAPTIAETMESWEPGRLRDDGRWKRYRLRGPGIYDGWGTEILCSVGGNGAIRLTSAGPDGAFRFHPGPDGMLATPPLAETPSADDRDGAADNVRIASERR